MYRRLGSTAARLKVISPGRYPDLSGPPYTRSSNTATAAPYTATEPSHQPSADLGGGQRQEMPLWVIATIEAR